MAPRTYRERWDAVKRKGAADAPRPGDDRCAPRALDCATAFELLVDGLTDLREEAGRQRGVLDDLRDRMAATQQHASSAWSEAKQTSHRLNRLPHDIEEALLRHAQFCSAREYASARIGRARSDSAIPAPARGDATQPTQVEPAAEAVEVLRRTVPRWVLYLGGGIGAAIVGAVSLLHALGVSIGFLGL